MFAHALRVHFLSVSQLIEAPRRTTLVLYMGSPGGAGKESCRPVQETQDPWVGRSPAAGNGSPLRILAWEIPWTEESARLHAVRRVARVGHDREHTHALYFYSLIRVTFLGGSYCYSFTRKRKN